MSKKIAGIVVYNPDIDRLYQNVEALQKQVDIIALANNGVQDSEILADIIHEFENVVVLGNGENVGVATALNTLAEYALQHGAEWLLTMDQDSVCESKLINMYEEYVSLEDIGLITCIITDRNFEYNQDNNVHKKYIDTCITSGSYIRLAAWKMIGGFDERMFIDHVDTDYCYRLKLEKWNILQIPYKGLLHEVGVETKRHKLFGKEFVVFNHSAFRCYYIVRNQIYFARKHEKTLGKRKSLRHQRTAWTRILIYMLYEKDRFHKLKAWLKGIFDGYQMEV